MNYTMYTDLAWLWPIISPPEEYVAESMQIASILRQGLSPRPEAGQRPTLLHLGCGGGHIDFTLKKYYRLTGIDLSPHMLELARQLNPGIDYLIGDMRTARLERAFDAVLVADSIDYMLDEADLRAAFQTAWEHLRPGGIFVTYAEETCERFENNRSTASVHTRDDIEVTLIENLYDPDPSDTTYEMVFVYLIRQLNNLSLPGSRRIEFDQHHAGLFPESTWRRLLEEVGFWVEQHKFPDEEFQYFIGQRPALDT